MDLCFLLNHPDIGSNIVEKMFDLESLQSLLTVCKEQQNKYAHGKWLISRIKVQYVKVLYVAKALWQKHQGKVLSCHFCGKVDGGNYKHYSGHLRSLSRNERWDKVQCSVCNCFYGDFDV